MMKPCESVRGEDQSDTRRAPESREDRFDLRKLMNTGFYRLQAKFYSRLLRASLVRVASLETEFAFEPAVEESEPPASTSRHASFGERFLFDQKLASFDERFAGADISVAEPEEGASNVLNYARLPSPDSGEHGIAQPATGRSKPKLAPAALSPPTSAARKRVATAEASKDSISPAYDDSRTAIYDIAARTVYLPNGRRLEAHSGFGSYMDDARYVNLKRQGPTPPNTYKLV